MKNKAVFVDRDGTINIDVHYLDDPDSFVMYPGVVAGIKKLKKYGFKIIVITNQSGIGRGFFNEHMLFKIHERMKEQFMQSDVILDGIYYCPHHPDDHCDCRKPNTGLFKQAIRDHNIDRKKSFMLGDKMLDIYAGKRIGATSILIPEPPMREEMLAQKKQWEMHPDFIAENFSDAVEWIINKIRDDEVTF